MALSDALGIQASTPMEQAHPLVFLCSDAARAITGITLVSDASSLGRARAGKARLSPIAAGLSGVRRRRA